jgi:predicted XRE-type DNA-binding protein
MARDFETGWEDTYSLEAVREIRVEYEALVETAVRSLREHGYSDREIGEALGVQQPAVTKRWRRE